MSWNKFKVEDLILCTAPKYIKFTDNVINCHVENTYFLKAIDLAFMIYIKKWLYHPKYISFDSYHNQLHLELVAYSVAILSIIVWKYPYNTYTNQNLLQLRFFGKLSITLFIETYAHIFLFCARQYYSAKLCNKKTFHHIYLARGYLNQLKIYKCV